MSGRWEVQWLEGPAPSTMISLSAGAMIRTQAAQRRAGRRKVSPSGPCGEHTCGTRVELLPRRHPLQEDAKICRLPRKTTSIARVWVVLIVAEPMRGLAKRLSATTARIAPVAAHDPRHWPRAKDQAPLLASCEARHESTTGQLGCGGRSVQVLPAH